MKLFFISKKIYVPLETYSRFCILNHPKIYKICDVMMSISIWDKMHFWLYLFNHSSLSHRIWSIHRYKQGKQFSGIFWTTWRTGTRFQVLFNLATCSNYSITNYVKISVFHFFENVNNWQLKMVTVNY